MSVDDRLLLAVERRRRDKERYCLRPLAYLDGRPPADGAIRRDDRPVISVSAYANVVRGVGALVVGRLALISSVVRSQLPCRYRVDGNLTEPDPGQAMEVIAVDNAFGGIGQAAEPGRTHSLAHPTTREVLLLWRQDLYGPFVATIAAGYSVSFAPVSELSLRPTLWSDARRLAGSCYLAYDNATRPDGSHISGGRHIILGPGWASICQHARGETGAGTPTAVSGLSPGAQPARQAALSPPDRLPQAPGAGSQPTRSAALPPASPIERDRLPVAQPAPAGEVGTEVRPPEAAATAGMPTDGLASMRERLLHEREQHLADRTQALEALEERARALLDDAQQVREGFMAALAAAEAASAEMAQLRRTAQDEFAALRDTGLEHLAQAEKDAATLRANHTVVENLQTIAAHLGAANGQPTSAAPPATPEPAQAYAHAPAAPYRPGAYTVGRSSSGSKPMDEKTFFARFQKLVADSGFTYDELDLKAFHLSVKCGDITILGGSSGTGKSSLPRLYAKALLGDEYVTERGCLMVNVSPTWMDRHDLLGHMNTLERRFYPSTTGLYQRLICAQVEHDNNEDGTGLHLVCLDEMNLAKPEHYFSEFMQLVERRPGEERVLQLFDATAAGDQCPYRDYAKVDLSPALRFVGTVNYDETTQLLSNRLLDRANVIELRADGQTAKEANAAQAQPNGPLVTLADCQHWRHRPKHDGSLARLLRETTEPLRKLGCPVSPRVRTAMAQFVGAAQDLLSEQEATDLQFAQRVVPKARAITSAHWEALEELCKFLYTNRAALPRSHGLVQQTRLRDRPLWLQES